MVQDEITNVFIVNRRISPISFLSLFLILVLSIILFDINGWNEEFITFFFFSAFLIAYIIPKGIKYPALSLERKAKASKLKFHIVSVFIYIVTLLFVGIMHILGDLKFPEFVILDGWKNIYVVATRVAWCMAGCLSYHYYYSLNIPVPKHEVNPNNSMEMERVVKKLDSPNFIKVLINAILFPGISVPLFISIADFLGLSFVRQFVTKFILGKVI